MISIRGGRLGGLKDKEEAQFVNSKGGCGRLREHLITEFYREHEQWSVTKLVARKGFNNCNLFRSFLFNKTNGALVPPDYPYFRGDWSL